MLVTLVLVGGAVMVAELVVISIFLFDCCMFTFPAGAMVQDLEVSKLRLPSCAPPPSFPAVLRMPHLLVWPWCILLALSLGLASA